MSSASAGRASIATHVRSGDHDDRRFNTYSNHVKLECHGNVLVDRTFTSREECEDFRDNNSFSCGGIDLTISC